VHFQILAKLGKGIQVILRHCNEEKNEDTATVEQCSADNYTCITAQVLHDQRNSNYFSDTYCTITTA
jgi:hypothetical protein